MREVAEFQGQDQAISQKGAGGILMNLFASLTSMDKQMVWGGDSIFSPS